MTMLGSLDYEYMHFVSQINHVDSFDQKIDALLN